MNPVKKIKATLTMTENRRGWKIVAHDRSALEATGLKPKHARAALLGKLMEHYPKFEIELEALMEYPPDIQQRIDQLDRDTELADKLADRIPALRHHLARELFGANLGQADIAEKLKLSQSYVAQLLKLEPEAASEMVARSIRRR